MPDAATIDADLTSTPDPRDGGAAGGREDEIVDGDALPASGVWMSWIQVAVLVAAVAFLGGSAVFFLENRPPSAAEVDVGFYQDMTTHHDQAVQLAMLELARGENVAVQGFAQEILIFQNRELGIMGLRLADWDVDTSTRPELAMEWMGMATPPSEMPGMASEGQIDALREAEGAAADALFLELMAEHHRGGVHMAANAAENADDGEVRRLAATMARYQAIEVNEMAQTAERLGFAVDIERAPVPPAP